MESTTYALLQRSPQWRCWKRLTIPLLELQGAVLGSRLFKTIVHESSFLFVKVILFLDSKIVLVWIGSEARKFKPFVPVRVGEIQNDADPSQWKHIPGELNVADDVSPGIPVRCLAERWQHGPKFLRLSESQWRQDSSNNDQPQVEDDFRKVNNVCAQIEAEHPINCQKFSSWKRLVRVTAYTLRLIWSLRAQHHNKTHPEENHMKPKEGPLSLQELQKAEDHWIKESQKSVSDHLRKGEFKMFSPYTYSDGIVWVGGRVDKALVAYETRHSALLPREHWISLLITRHVHQCGHTAVVATVAKTRRRFWILKAHDLAKTVKSRWMNCLNAVWPLVHRRFITRPAISLARTMLKLVVTRQPSIIEWYSPAWIPKQFAWNLL